MSHVQLFIVGAGAVAGLGARRAMVAQFSRQARHEFLEWLYRGDHRG